MKASAAHGIINQVLTYTMAGIGLSGSIGVGAVWMREQISQTANANKLLEARIADLTRRGEETQTAIAQEEDMGALLRKNAAMNIGLAPPREDQVQRVTVDPAVRLASKRNSEISGDAAVTLRLATEP